MSARGLLIAMLGGTVLVVALCGRRSEPARTHATRPHPPEQPWLRKDAAAELIGPGGTLGPLFAGITLGGTAPSQEARARIEEFARAHHIAIELEVVGDELAAIRLSITYGGCCGYEGADVLALRLDRPSTGHCCVCGPDRWIDDWSLATEDGLEVRARVHVNRVDVRWRAMLSLPELLEHADGLIGQWAHTAGTRAGDDWLELDHGSYLLATPYPFRGAPPYQTDRSDDGELHVSAEAGRIAEVTFTVHDDQETVSAAVREAARYSTHLVTSEHDDYSTEITVREHHARD